MKKRRKFIISKVDQKEEAEVRLRQKSKRKAHIEVCWNFVPLLKQKRLRPGQLDPNLNLNFYTLSK